MSHTYSVISCTKTGHCDDIVLVTDNYHEAVKAERTLKRKVCECCEAVKYRTLYIIGGTTKIGELVLKL